MQAPGYWALPRAMVVAGVFVCGVSLFFVGRSAQAQAITADGTAVGLSTTVNQAGVNYQISGGTLSGNNQFYSFGKLNVPTGGSADFQATSAGIQNILARVTGGTASNIDGGIMSTITGSGGAYSNANLFLMNPAGILFGFNAWLDVAGSFHATTADYIKLGNDGIFYADPARGTVLTTSPPSAFGFLTANPAPIQYDSFLNTVDDKTLSLVGGPITIGEADGSAAGWMIALDSSFARVGGRINLVSVASVGEAAFDGTTINTNALPQLGNITIQGGSIIDAKDIEIRGGKLEVTDSFVFPGGLARIFPDTDPNFGFGWIGLPNGGGVDVGVRNQVAISGTDFIYGFTPGIRTWSGSQTAIAPALDAPDITIKAGSVLVSGVATIRSERFGPGNAADITIDTDLLQVRNGGEINLSNAYAGPGGTMTIKAQQIELSGDGSPRFTGLSAQSNFHPGYFAFDATPEMTSADAATITIQGQDGKAPPSLTVRQAQITADSTNFGRSGDITINASDIAMSDGGAILAQSLFAGESGNVRVTATGDINISGGARISASTAGSGDGGVVEVKAGRSLTLSGTDSAIFSVTVPVPDTALDALAVQILGAGATFSDLVDAIGLDPATATIFDVIDALNFFGFSAVADLTPGDGGKVSITAPQLSLSNGAVLSTSTLWDGNAGQIEGKNVTNLTVSSGAEIRSQSGGIGVDNQPAVGTGQAGTVVLTASDAITVSGTGSTISTTTFGDGNGGNVELIAGNQVSILDGGRVKADSGGLLGGSIVSGTGLAGDVKITSGNQITLDNGQITTQALTADGGNITLMAPNIVQLQDSTISTSVGAGEGKGGNILIDPTFVILNNSSIIANAFGGPGGNITIIADNFLSSATSVVEASSALSTPGVIQITSPDNNVENSIAQLASAFLDASSQLRGPCSARRAGAPSSFVVAGKGGVPVDADGYRPSFGTDFTTGLASTSGPVRADAGPLAGPPLRVALMTNDRDCLR